MLFYCAFQIWELFPIEVQKVQSVAYFKKAINQCKSKICPCCLCRAQTFRLISCTQFVIREKKKLFILSSEKPFYRGPDNWEFVSMEIEKFQHVSIKFSINANQRVVLFFSNVRTFSIGLFCVIIS